MKYKIFDNSCLVLSVALFTRAWIEITGNVHLPFGAVVALFTRAWIEIPHQYFRLSFVKVALFTRAWIEIEDGTLSVVKGGSRPLHEGVD